MSTTRDKPSGLPVFPPHAGEGDSVLARLLADQPWRGDVAWPEGFEGGIAHRLDTDTSGALLVADDPDELARIRDAFRGGALRKTYVLRSARDVPWDTNTCDREIGHDPRHRGRMVVRRGADTPHRGRWYPAHTELRRAGRVWEVVITTGVMHQIRVHAAFLGLPILGDGRYGGGAAPAGGPRLYLHHRGLAGAGFATSPVPTPEWAAP